MKSALKNTLQWFSQLDLFNLGVIFMVWYLVAYFLVPVAIGLGVRSAYLSSIADYELFLYSWKYFAVVFLGLVSFGAGFYLVSFKSKQSKPIFAEPQPVVLKFLFIVTYGTGLVVKIFKVLTDTYLHLGKNPAITQSAFAAFLGIAEWLGILGLGLGFGLYFYLKKRGSAEHVFWQRLMLGVFVLEIIYNFFSLSKMSLLAPIVVYLLMQNYFQGKDWRRVLAWAFIFQFLLAPLQSRLNVPQVFENYVSAWQKKSGFEKLAKPLATADFAADGVFARLDQSRTLAKIMFYHTEFAKGETLKNFFISLGPPRFLWRDKPLVHTGHNEFGRAYNILGTQDYTTSVGPGIVGEWYLNFGFFGVWLGLLGLGALLAMITKRLITAPGTIYNTAVYVVLVLMIMHAVEGWIGAGFAEIVKQFIIMILVYVVGLNYPKIIAWLKRS